MGPNETEKNFLHSKGNYKQGEKTALRLGENKSKWDNWQRINFQNIQVAHKTPCQKIKVVFIYFFFILIFF